MDITIETPPVSALDLAGSRKGEATAPVAARVAAARQIQSARGTINARLSEAQVTEFARPDEPARQLLLRACDQLGLSARGYTRTLKVARTLADLEGQESLARHHVAEAISFRRSEPSAQQLQQTGG